MLEKIYEKSPYFLKVLMLNIKAFLNNKQRYSAEYKKHLDRYNTLWSSKTDTYKNYQKEQLKNLLLECYDHVTWYRIHFEEIGILRENILDGPFEVLKQLPLLSKEDRKSKVESLINTNPNRPEKEVGYTSGTSGSPTKNYMDLESIERSFALWTRFHRSIGLGRNERTVRFSGRLIVNPKAKKPPFWVYNRVEDQLFMSSYHLSDVNCLAYIRKLNSFKPTFIDGYPSAIYVIAKKINNDQLELTYTPKAIAVTAETLYDYQRIEIERAFRCSVYNQYASSEGSPFITECIAGNLHINEDSGVFEFLNTKDEPAQAGEVGRMVVTSFRNLKTPLIRYDIQDTVLMPKDQSLCSCGCEMSMVDKLIGREDDVLWTEEKGYVGRMDTAYKGLVGIDKSQIIQSAPDRFTINNVVDASFTLEIEKKFIKNLKDRLGQNVKIELNQVEEIPLGPNGKFDAVKRIFKVPE